jgi:hypothetical protein
VVARRSTPVLFRTVILAFGTVAPEGSLMKPEILPRSDCANTIPKVVRHKQSAKALTRHTFFMLSPHFEIFNRGLHLGRSADRKRLSDKSKYLSVKSRKSAPTDQDFGKSLHPLPGRVKYLISEFPATARAESSASVR